jgi:hypothetical protein
MKRPSINDAEFKEWAKLNAPPDLQALVKRWGGYDKIPVAAWAQWDQEVAAWQERRKGRFLK